MVVTNRHFDPQSPESADLLNELGSDRLYRRLCKSQECFRARLTPKPWRCGSPKPPNNFPREDDEQIASFSHWLSRYEEKSASYAVCALRDTWGEDRTTDAAATILAIHDRLVLGDGSKPLA